jgi:hypothetical protein
MVDPSTREYVINMEWRGPRAAAGNGMTLK